MDAVLFQQGGLVAVYEGDGTGSLQQAKTYGVDLPRVAVAADFNGDDHLDLVSVSDSKRTISVLYGDGRGSFEGNEVLLRPAGLRSEQKIGDVNGDGHVDLISRGGSRIETLAGNGEGSLEQPVLAFVADHSVREMELGNIDGDGLPDLVLLGSDSVFSVAFCNGDGTFGRPITVDVGNRPCQMIVGDFNEDGHTDVMVGTDSCPVRLYLYDPLLGNFSARTDVLPNLLESRPYPALTEDINGDGHLDVIIHRSSTPFNPHNRLSVLLGDGTGNFVVTNHLVSDDWSKRPGFSIALSDMDGDDALDLVTREPSLRAIAIRRGSGHGTFGPRETWIKNPPSGLFQIADLDGKTPDETIVFCPMSRNGDGMLRIYSAGGTMAASTDLPGSYHGLLALGDFDEDGATDILLTHDQETDVWLLLNRTRSFNCRRGNVNAGAGNTTNVLFLNDSPGFGSGRILRLAADDPFVLQMKQAPSGGRYFALYAWTRPISSFTTRELPLSLGFSCLPMPANNPSGVLEPRAIWKNIDGHGGFLGTATHPSSRAPSLVVDLPGGIGFIGEITFQGLMVDPGSQQGVVAITNAIVVKTH